SIDALWSLVWRGLITNDSLHALRAYIARPDSVRTPRRVQTGVAFRSRRTTPPTAQGRWSLLPLRATSGLKGKGSTLKGTGFSPHISGLDSDGALAPEGNSSAPTATEVGAPSLRLFSGARVGDHEPQSDTSHPTTELLASPSLKGTGFSPYIDPSQSSRALAPEGPTATEAGAPSLRLFSGARVGDHEPQLDTSHPTTELLASPS